ncbi:Ribosomal protein S6 [Methanosarcina sp. Kolksee]|nr:Ribosomal protein S6 [Methanosarcina sp. Kolksee]
MEMQKVQLIEGDVWGHRKDINEYYTVPSSVISKMRCMKAEGIPSEKIAEKLAHESKLSPEMISYILNKKDLE